MSTPSQNQPGRNAPSSNQNNAGKVDANKDKGASNAGKPADDMKGEACSTSGNKAQSGAKPSNI